MLVLDSNIVIYSAYPDNSFLRSYILTENVMVASLSVIEVLGYHKLDAADRKYFETFFQVIPVLELSKRIVDIAVSIRQKHNIAVADSIIAATAIGYNAELITRNTDDFKHIKGLKLSDPFKK